MSELPRPRFLKIVDIQRIIKCIFCSSKRPNFLQLNPKPKKIGVILVKNDLSTNQSEDCKNIKIRNKIYPSLDSNRNSFKTSVSNSNDILENKGFTKVHLNEHITNDELYYNLLKSKDINKISLSCITPENLSLIERTDINHMFSYSFYIKSQLLFDSTQFNSYARPNKITPYFLVALDCEMMICQSGKQLGKISIIDHTGKLIYDKFIRPETEVIDYVEKYSGLNYKNTGQGISLSQMKKDILEIIGTNTVILGHGLENDLECIELYTENLIDTAYLFLSTDGFKIGLAQLSRIYFGEKIHHSSHDSKEDAFCCLKLLSYKITELLNFQDPNGECLDINVKTKEIEINNENYKQERTIYFIKRNSIDEIEFVNDLYYFVLLTENEQNYIYFKQRN